MEVKKRNTGKYWALCFIWTALMIVMLAIPAARPYFWLALPGAATYFVLAMDLM